MKVLRECASVEKWEQARLLHISHSGVSCSLIPRSCAFVTCSLRFCANFVLHVTNVQGLGMRLGLLAYIGTTLQRSMCLGILVPWWSSNLCRKLLLLNILQVRDDRYVCREETYLLIKCQFTFSCHPSAANKASYQPTNCETLCNLLPAGLVYQATPSEGG